MSAAVLVPPTAGVADDYASIEALNWSTLRHLATSPRLLRWRAEHPREDSTALRVGRAIHCAVLEPERFDAAYIVAPKVDKRTKAGKAEWAAFVVESTASGAEILDAEEHALAVRCAEAVRSHPRARDLLRGGRAEETITWTDPETGIRCKARADWITPNYILDLKSTRATSIAQINAEIARYLYHGQLAYYHDGAITARVLPESADGPYVLAVQTVEPYDVVPVRIVAGDLATGRALYRSLLRQYAQCSAADWWPGLAPDVIDSDLPRWAAAGESEEGDW